MFLLSASCSLVFSSDGRRDPPHEIRLLVTAREPPIVSARKLWNNHSCALLALCPLRLAEIFRASGLLAMTGASTHACTAAILLRESATFDHIKCRYHLLAMMVENDSVQLCSLPVTCGYYYDTVVMYTMVVVSGVIRVFCCCSSLFT